MPTFNEFVRNTSSISIGLTCFLSFRFVDDAAACMASFQVCEHVSLRIQELLVGNCLWGKVIINIEFLYVQTCAGIQRDNVFPFSACTETTCLSFGKANGASRVCLSKASIFANFLNITLHLVHSRSTVQSFSILLLFQTTSGINDILYPTKYLSL